MSTFLNSKQLYEASMLAYQGDLKYLEENKGHMIKSASLERDGCSCTLR